MTPEYPAILKRLREKETADEWLQTEELVLLDYVDSLTQQREEARGEVARLSNICQAVATLTYQVEQRGGVIAPSDLNDALGGRIPAALAVTAPPETPNQATLQGQDWALPEKSVSTPLGAGVIEGLRYDGIGNEWWAVRVNGKVELFRPDELAPPEPPETPEHAVTCEPFQPCICGATPEED